MSVRERLMTALEALAEAATDHGAEADDEGVIDLETLTDSDDPVLHAIGEAGDAITEALADLGAEDEDEDETAEMDEEPAEG
jgi:hypothetical protein